MAAHLDRFDELVVSMEAVGEPMDEARQLVILLGSPTSEYDTLVSIIENTPSPVLLDVKEKLLKAEEKAATKEDNEVAFKVRAVVYKARVGQSKHREWSRAAKDSGRNKKGFAGKSFVCGRLGHKAAACTSRGKKDDNEITFMASDASTNGWLVNSGASSHMSPSRSDCVEFQPLCEVVMVTVANGTTVSATGIGEVVVKLQDGVIARIKDLLYIPGIGRRLLAVPKMDSHGLAVEFGGASCQIKRDGNVVMEVKKVGSVYVVDLAVHVAMVVEHGPRSSERELWHGRLGHPSDVRA